MTTSDLLKLIATGLANGKLSLNGVVHVKLSLNGVVHVNSMGHGGFVPAVTYITEPPSFQGELWIECADDTDTTERPPIVNDEEDDGDDGYYGDDHMEDNDGSVPGETDKPGDFIDIW